MKMHLIDSPIAVPLLAAGFAFEDLLLPLGIALIIAAIFFRIRKRQRDRATGNPTPSEHLEKVRQAKGLRADLEDIMVDIEELSRRFSAQLDAKAVRLEKLIRDADERLEELRRLSAAGGQGNASAAASEPPGEPRRPHDEQETREIISRLNGESSGTSSPDAAATEQTGAGPGVDPLTKRVLELADQGLKAVQIAQLVDEDIGKVELILALRHT